MSAESSSGAAGPGPGGAPGLTSGGGLILRRVHHPDPALLRELEAYDMAAFGPTGLRTYDLAVMAEAGAVLLAYLGAEVVGGCQLMRMLDEPGYFYVVGLYVREPWRGRRFGGELLRLVAAESRALGAEGLVLTVAPDNAAALALYEAAEFVRERFVSAFYGENEDRLILRWRFPDRQGPAREGGLPGGV